MNPGALALIVLFLVIIIGFIRKINVGILAIVGAAILAYTNDQFEARAIARGFSPSLFLTLLGITFLFCIIQNNGVLEKLVKKYVSKIGDRIYLIPIVVYLIGLTVAAIGPGCIPALVLVAAISIPLAHKSGYNPIMLMLIGDTGSYAGRFTSITPEGILINKLLGEQGFENVIFPLFVNAVIVTVIISVIFYLGYKGYKVKYNSENEYNQDEEEINLSKNDILCLFGVVLLILFVTVLRLDIGMSGFIIGSLLLIAKVDNEKNIIKLIPWSTIIMVTGVGVLMNFVISSGGIKLLTDIMSSVMTPKTAPAISGLTAGVMSWFSSTVGVVLPTLLPTVGGIVENIGGNVSVSELVTTIGITSSFAGFSPASTVGALIIAAYSSDAVFSKMDSNKVFLSLFGWSAFCVVFIPLLSLTGIFGLIK